MQPQGSSQDNERALRYYKKDQLFACLVKIVEALACLHEQLGAYHLYMKPDNILVLEKDRGASTPGRQDRYELIWKLSDFGLAEKQIARQSAYPADSSYTPSILSTIRSLICDSD